MLHGVLHQNLEGAGNRVTHQIRGTQPVHDYQPFRITDLHQFPVGLGKLQFFLDGDQLLAFLIHEVTVQGSHLLDVLAGFFPGAVLYDGVQHVEAVEQEMRVHLVLEGHIAELGLMAAGPLFGYLLLLVDGEVHHEDEGHHGGDNEEHHDAGVFQHGIAGVIEVRVNADAEDQGHGRHQPAGVLVPGLFPFIAGGPVEGEAVREQIQSPADPFRDQERGDGVVPDGRKDVFQHHGADVSQQEADDVHQDEGRDGDFHREVFPEADESGQRHGEGGEQQAVPHAHHRAQHGNGYVQQREAVDEPSCFLPVHGAKLHNYSVRRKKISIRTGRSSAACRFTLNNSTFASAT